MTTGTRVRLAAATALAVAAAGALYLYAVRGPAILLDLAKGAAGMICF